MASASYSQFYPASPSLPILTGKGQYAQYSYGGYYPGAGEGTYSVSPPEDLDASVTSSASGVASYGSSSAFSVTSSAESSQGDGEYDYASSSGVSGAGTDIQAMMEERFADSFDPLPLDKCMAVQAQTSGQLNAKQHQLLELQAKAQARLAKARTRFAEGLEEANEVRANLDWTQKKVSALKSKAAKKFPKDYAKARTRFPSPEPSS